MEYSKPQHIQSESESFSLILVEDQEDKAYVLTLKAYTYMVGVKAHFSGLKEAQKKGALALKDPFQTKTLIHSAVHST